MTGTPIQVCTVCGHSYWSMGVPAENGFACPACQGAAIPVVGCPAFGKSREIPRKHLQFVSLSALPLEQRRPRRREGTKPGLMAPRRMAEVRTTILPLPELLPEPPPVQHLKPPLCPAPEPIPPVVARQLGFNCPSCFTVLIIKEPDTYDGRAAPCPYCRVTILPPRIVQPSPFTLVATPQSEGAAAPPPLRPSRWRRFGPHEMEPSLRECEEVA